MRVKIRYDNDTIWSDGVQVGYLLEGSVYVNTDDGCENAGEYDHQSEVGEIIEKWCERKMSDNPATAV